MEVKGDVLFYQSPVYDLLPVLHVVQLKNHASKLDNNFIEVFSQRVFFNLVLLNDL